MNDFTATPPARLERYKRPKTGVYREREWPRFSNDATPVPEKERRTRVEEGTGWVICTPQNILIVEFSVRAAYPLEPLCPLPAADLLIINYLDNELQLSTTTPLLDSLVKFAASFRSYNHFFFFRFLIFISCRRFLWKKRNECPPPRGRSSLIIASNSAASESSAFN